MRLQTDQFHILSSLLHDSFSVFASKNAYVESSSLLVRDAKRESSKFFSPIVHVEEESTFTGKTNISGQY
jgi:hypothetical protein